jgi:hypothetical protein
MDVLSPVSAGFILRSACTAVASAGSKGDHQVSALRILLNDNNAYRQGKEAEPYDPAHGEGWSVRAQDLSMTILAGQHDQKLNEIGCGRL